MFFVGFWYLDRRIDRVNAKLEEFLSIEAAICEINNSIDKLSKNHDKHIAKNKKHDESINKLAIVANELSNDVAAMKFNIHDNSERLSKKIESVYSIEKRFITYHDNIKYLEDLQFLAKQSYEKYVGQVKSELSEFKESDRAIQRLASIESRITLLEGKLKKNEG